MIALIVALAMMGLVAALAGDQARRQYASGHHSLDVVARAGVALTLVVAMVALAVVSL